MGSIVEMSTLLFVESIVNKLVSTPAAFTPITLKDTESLLAASTVLPLQRNCCQLLAGPNKGDSMAPEPLYDTPVVSNSILSKISADNFHSGVKLLSPFL